MEKRFPVSHLKLHSAIKIFRNLKEMHLWINNLQTNKDVTIIRIF